MHIDFIEISNFRKLQSARIELSSEKTIFVGPNNSGKTSAMTALRHFLLSSERSRFCFNDFTLSHWSHIKEMGEVWERAYTNDQELPVPDWDPVLPFLDIWLHVAENELHYVRAILPSLDWKGELLGVRMRLELKDAIQLQKEYVSIRAKVLELQKKGCSSATEQGQSNNGCQVTIWPRDLTDFLQQKLRSLFEVKAYILDPAACVDPQYGIAKPQPLNGREPLDSDPLRGLIRVDEISAQRGFGTTGGDSNKDGDINANGSRKLSAQFQEYYSRHLDPSKNPDESDIFALKAIEDAQQAFNLRLEKSFEPSLNEMHRLGYPGVTDPELNISTRLRPVEGLNHDAAVQFTVPVPGGEKVHLPENSNGLGYQNLISMVFRLMAFRDGWMRVGKARTELSNDIIVPPLHLVLIEEPEVHLHTQVQQVFIRQAYKILRNQQHLEKNKNFVTQMIVSTHSSHIVNECEFDSIRYFRRLRDPNKGIPISCVINMKNTFGDDEDTKRFVTRYLRTTHCDLFFADAAILIEGLAERILVPSFVRYHQKFKKLSEGYITWLEIGGSHAHKLRNLIEMIGLTTLIITDIDSCDDQRKRVPPEYGLKQKTNNFTLKNWWPKLEYIDDLLDLGDDGKVKTYQGENFSIRVAYQSPIDINFKNKYENVTPYTFEDAIVMTNLDLFKSLEGKGLVAKFCEVINSDADLSTMKIIEALKKGGKAEFALDLLEIKDPASLMPPTYISAGLLWLANELERKRVELGLAQITESNDESLAGEASEEAVP